MTAGAVQEDLPAALRGLALNRSMVKYFAALGALGLVLGGGLGYAATLLLPASYSSQSEIVLTSATANQPALGSGPISTAATDPLSVAQILRSADVSTEASHLLHGRLSPDQVSGQITVGSVTGSTIVTIQATATSPQLAQDLANAVPQAYLDVQAAANKQHAADTAKVLNQLLGTQEQQLADLEKQMAATVQAVVSGSADIPRASQAGFVQATLDANVGYQQLRNEAAALTSRIGATDDAIQRSALDATTLQSGVDRVISGALPSESLTQTRIRDIELGALIGAALGCLLAWPLAARRRPVDPAAASAILGAPLLGAIPPTRQLRRRASGFLDFAQDSRLVNELKVVASSMVLSAHRRALPAIVISSAHRREGKTVLARNLAAAAEYVGHPVVLVDAGFGRPSTTELLGLDQCPGIAEVVEGAPVSEVMHYVPYDGVGRLPVISLGLDGFATEPGRRLNKSRRDHWGKALVALRPMTPLVDAPAINDHPLALQLAAGGGLVVVVSPRTTLADLEVVRNRADVADVPILGLIIDESWPRAGKYPRKPITDAHPERNIVIDTEPPDDVVVPADAELQHSGAPAQRTESAESPAEPSGQQ